MVSKMSVRKNEQFLHKPKIIYGHLFKGYDYVMIDDCWSEMERDKTTGRLVPDRKRFPNGIKGSWYNIRPSCK